MPADEGGRAWFEPAVLEVLPDLLGTALRLTKNRADAEDLVADAVAKAWLARGSLRERDRFRGWIFRILTNLFLSERRTLAGRPAEQSLDERGAEFSLFERLHQPFLLWWSTPEQEFLDKLAREDLARAIDTLPETFRLVVVLADVQGFSYRAIAETLAVPVGTVRSRLARGRALLQSVLWEHACDAGLGHTVRHRKPDIA
ncbi:MAG: sigma-70 family RNA polymerase sigma factor [Gemmatimonadales bacterium]